MHLELEKPKLVNPKLFAARMAQLFCIIGMIVFLYFIVKAATSLFGPSDGSAILLGFGLISAIFGILGMQDHIRENNGWWPEPPAPPEPSARNRTQVADGSVRHLKSVS